MAKLIISSSPGGAIAMPSQRLQRRHRRKSKSRRARDHANRLPGAWLMDVQDSFSDCAR